MKITEGSTVTIDYTMSLDDGELVDSTEHTDPLTYVQGQGEIISGMEKALLGKTKGEKLDVTVAAADGFGESDPDAFIEIPKSDLPPEGLEAGTELEGQGPQGQSISGKVVEVKDTSAIVDFNHPMAGKTLHFSVTVVDVQ